MTARAANQATGKKYPTLVFLASEPCIERFSKRHIRAVTCRTFQNTAEPVCHCYADTAHLFIGSIVGIFGKQ